MYSYWLGLSGLIFSMYKSISSGLRLVMPQAMSALCPMTMPGVPGNEKPTTSNGHSGDTVRQCSPTSYQMEGMAIPRWGSLARSGRPVELRSPEIAQLFDPMPAPLAPMSRSSWLNDERSSASAGMAMAAAGVAAGGAPI